MRHFIHVLINIARLNHLVKTLIFKIILQAIEIIIRFETPYVRLKYIITIYILISTSKTTNRRCSSPRRENQDHKPLRRRQQEVPFAPQICTYLS